MFEHGSGLYASVTDQLTTAFNMLTQTSSPPTAPVVHATIPPLYLFQFPPSPEPQVLSPPVADHTFARPFDINAELYNNALHVAIPISVAIIYATTVTFLSRVNKQREYKPWAISKSLPFYAFVVTHNIFLALYSGWTCLGMIRAITHSWPGWEGEHKLVAVVDTLCKINGPRGLGSAASFNHDSGSWGVTDQAVHLLGGSPDSTDVGRIWNEGLAFYGWLFYVSKFYELVDTFIILAKGKKSSALQTYHHAGAMMCMWAGIRYMSPPIWMFVLINSGLHAYMVRSTKLRTISTSYADTLTVHLLHSICPYDSSSFHLEKGPDNVANCPMRVRGFLRGCSSFHCLQRSRLDPLFLHSQSFLRDPGCNVLGFLRDCKRNCDSRDRQLAEEGRVARSWRRRPSRERAESRRRNIWDRCNSCRCG